jgi:hypothetical protein
VIETPTWQPAEFELRTSVERADPFQECQLRATFTGPSGRPRRVHGFWDGGDTWRVRFAPDEVGAWTGITTCDDTADAGLHGRTLQLTVREPEGDTAFERHGPVRVSDDRRHFAHLDGTPFLWLADTGWNGPLLSDDAEWRLYLETRARQGFTTVQWTATHWLASVDGDRDGRKAYSGRQRITIDPVFFQRLDGKVEALRRAGLMGVPVLLWAAEWTADPAVNATNPGTVLPEDQAILLARHMVARWDAYPVAWFLPGDGPYEGQRASRWQRIGRAVFGDVDHAPVTLHPNGMSWYAPDFDAEAWLDFIGYQSGHGDDDATVRWLTEGPPARGWQALAPRPIVNLEPPYEDHIGYQSQRRFTAADVRKRLGWSLLVTPTAGVTYGGHGVWGWDDGTTTPQNHPTTGVPRPWQEALRLQGAEQIAHLATLLGSLEWWRLVPAPELVVDQPGGHRHIAASRSDTGDLAVVYVPEDREVSLRLDLLQPGLRGTWVSTATGEAVPAAPCEATPSTLMTPAPGDWWLKLSAG